MMLKLFKRIHMLPQIHRLFLSSKKLLDVPGKKNWPYDLYQRSFAPCCIQWEDHKKSVLNQIDIERRKDDALIYAHTTPYR